MADPLTFILTVRLASDACRRLPAYRTLPVNPLQFSLSHARIILPIVDGRWLPGRADWLVGHLASVRSRGTE